MHIFYSTFASIKLPLQVILKTDCEFNLGLDPNSIVSVLPKCRRVYCQPAIHLQYQVHSVRQIQC